MRKDDDYLNYLVRSYLDFNINVMGSMRDKFNINGKSDFEVSMRQFQILMALTYNTVDTVSGFEKVFKISKSSLSITIKKMINAGLLCKKENDLDSDKRTVHFCLTPKGEEIANKFDNMICSSFRAFYEPLTDEQKENINIGIEHLGKVFNNKEE